MKIFDLSHPITGSMPFYPGTAPPSLTASSTIEGEGFAEKRISLLTHTGTHLDAPAHILQGAKTLDRIEIDKFYGRAVVLDFTGFSGGEIRPEDLEQHRRKVAQSRFVLINTGWNRLWGSGEYFRGFPALSPEAAHWISGFNLNGVGVDTASVDAAGAAGFPVHEKLLGSGLIIVENLTGLDSLAGTQFTFCCFPLKIEAADGSPVRAVALVHPGNLPKNRRIKRRKGIDNAIVQSD